MGKISLTGLGEIVISHDTCSRESLSLNNVKNKIKVDVVLECY